MQCGPSNRRLALTSSQEHLVGSNQNCTDNSFTGAMKPQTESENVKEARYEIGK